MMTCLIIDDEPLAHKVIKNYSETLSFLSITKTFHSALDAIGYLNDHKVDLIFLDINMPKLKGLDFLRTLKDPPMVIITSAYQEFALEGYELDIIDYLLKPFSIERFIKAVNKAQRQKKMMEASEKPSKKVTIDPSSNQKEKETIFVKGDKKTHQIRLDAILFIESYGSYLKIHLDNEIITTLERLKNFESTLPINQFIRVHKSYIVAVTKIQVIEGNRLQVSGHSIPIGNIYKHNLTNLITS
ncbi:LytTR family DNA-binding domain-containing protein [Aquimarina sp. 2201CG5-10]|uniref:LytR/AlgR family response regulator transcription factor n=1 Tax=Aquimarina callyspongiae TaxID=3098150 RepID=UPI002AB4A65F|nr:LytTR family DNA-binding domain-containing protein [Aquimarina sp. 2201CG5-10]MDY8135863.1 LytTR family DNA-binding domain-containing protein [Aquimarina sp. 2201CG5-10]